MRNSFYGILSGVFDQWFYYEVHGQAREISFKSLITKRSFFDLELYQGSEVFLPSKLTAIHEF
jgi:hypothetical protein